MVDTSDRQQGPLYEPAFAFLSGEALDGVEPLDGQSGLKATEDAVVSVADAVATAYLAAMAQSAGGLIDVRLPACVSTRGAERFRNEAALRRWLRRTFVTVQEIYEDRFGLWALLPGGVTATTGALGRAEVRRNRRAQLDELKGARLFSSLLVEFSDVAYPLLRAFSQRAGRVLSFVLVTVIGQGIGLVARGVRLALRPDKV